MAKRKAICNQKGCPMVYQIKGKLYAKNQGPESRDEKSDMPFEHFRDRRTDIVGYRGVIFKQKGCPKVNRIKGKLYTRNQGPDSRDKKVICLLSNFETDGHCGL